MKPINRSIGYNSNEENGHALNGDADYLQDLENAAAVGGNSRGIGMQDLAKEAQNAQDYDLPSGRSGSTSRRGSILNNNNPAQAGPLNGFAAANSAESSAGTSSAHSPRMAAASIHPSRVQSPAAHTNPFLSAPPLNRSSSKDGDKNPAQELR